jgi:hypothetical protein
LGKIVKIQRRQPPKINTEYITEKGVDTLYDYLPATILPTHLHLARSVYNKRCQDGDTHFIDTICGIINLSEGYRTMNDVLEKNSHCLRVPVGFLNDLYLCSLVNIKVAFEHNHASKYLVHTDIKTFCREAFLFSGSEWEDAEHNAKRESILKYLMTYEIIKLKNARIVLAHALALALSKDYHPIKKEIADNYTDERLNREFFKQAHTDQIYEWASEKIDSVDDWFDYAFEWDLGVQALLEQNRERVLYDPTFKYIRDMIMRTNAHDEDEEDD